MFLYYRRYRKNIPKPSLENIQMFFQPDSNEIVGRLMQIRDYIKQASSMMDNLKKSSDPVSNSLSCLLYLAFKVT